MRKTAAIIQARTGSTRLPGKVLIELFGKTVLEHVIHRVQQTSLLDEIIIATTCATSDDPIVEIAKKCGVECFRGSETDVLSRYYHAAKHHGADVIARITSDCPLIDPHVNDDIIRYYHQHDYSIVLNAGDEPCHRTYPRGLDIEVFSFGELEEAFFYASKPYEREHVTSYIFDNKPKVYYYKNDADYSQYRWTLDTSEDLDFIKEVYKHFYRGSHNFYFKDILEFLRSNPQISQINSSVEQKNPRV